eukprot:7050276-Pyramimonas_sp.AAC.1
MRTVRNDQSAPCQPGPTRESCPCQRSAQELLPCTSRLESSGSEKKTSPSSFPPVVTARLHAALLPKFIEALLVLILSLSLHPR